MKRCLIVEASPIIRRITKAILTDFGYDVAEAATGREGISAFQRHIPRLAVVDAGLTDVAALDVLRQMRGLAQGRCQILYCTTQFDVLELQRAHAAGATDLLIKPFDRRSLQSKLNSWQPPGQTAGQATEERGAAEEHFFRRLSRSELVRI